MKTQTIITRILQFLTIALPIQSILVIFLVTRLGLPKSIALWKELFEIIAMLLMSFGIIKSLTIKKLPKFELFRELLPIIIVFLITMFVLLGSFGRIPFTNILYGFRFELYWVWFFAILWVWVKNLSVTHFTELKASLIKSSILGLVVTLGFTLIIMLIGQEKFFSSIGIGSGSIKEFAELVPTQVVDGGGWSNLQRISGTFTTPNHFAGYLLIMLGVIAEYARSYLKKYQHVLLILGTSLAIIFSFARYAWLILLVFFGVWLVKNLTLNSKVKVFLFSILYIFPMFIGVVAINLPESFLQNNLPTFISKPSSTTFHARRTNAALDVLTKNSEILMKGYGLGASGPAAKEVYSSLENNRLYTENITIALKRFLEPREIIIPENWFLQLSLNGGVGYAFLYSIFVLLPIIITTKKQFITPNYLWIGLYGIVIGSLFLHIWENHTIAIFFAMFSVFLFQPFDKTPLNHYI
jgi:hypothetical protein